jgi:Protein of unknown function (DUF3551)
MRYFLFVVGFFVVTAAINTRAEAQNFPWCARYSYRDGATCGFTTFEQCMATIRGIGGFCEPNNQYGPTIAPVRQKSHTHYPS